MKPTKKNVSVYLHGSGSITFYGEGFDGIPRILKVYECGKMDTFTTAPDILDPGGEYMDIDGVDLFRIIRLAYVEQKNENS